MVRSGFDRAFGGRRIDAEDPVRLDPSPLNGGVRLDASALEIPLSAAVKLEDCRFEENGIRKDFGYVGIGDAAESRVLGLAEHKFIDSNNLFHRLVRIIRNASDQAELYAWDGSSWVLVDDTASGGETIENKPLVMFSTQGKLVMTEGTQILQWSEVPTTSTIEHDFPSGNDLVSVGEETQVTISNADAYDGRYTFHYSVTINGTASADKTLVLGFYHEGVKIDEVSYVSPSGSSSDSWSHETLEVYRPSLEDNDTLSIKVESLDVTTTTVHDSFGAGDATVDAIATKSVTAEASGDEYNYKYTVTLDPWPGIGSKPSMTIGLYRDSGSGWVKERESTFTNGSDEQQVNNVIEGLVIDGMGNGDKFGLNVESTTGGGNTLTPDEVFYDTGISISVHGFNKATDGDAAAGVTHEKRTGTTSSFGLLDAGAPAATFVFPFGDRLLALQDTGDPQKLSWTVDGDITDWSGTGSGSTSLLDARSDPLDDLIALGAVASNIAVLFRKRSMMRVYETGDPTLAIGVEHWIEGIGTESPLSVKQVRDGVMFLGHDMMVYYFTGSGAPQPVGEPIQREIVEDVSEGELETVEATYDPVFGEYWIKIPSKTWIFDLGEYLENREIKWRSKSIVPQRMAVVSRIS